MTWEEYWTECQLIQYECYFWIINLLIMMLVWVRLIACWNPTAWYFPDPAESLPAAAIDTGAWSETTRTETWRWRTWGRALGASEGRPWWRESCTLWRSWPARGRPHSPARTPAKTTHCSGAICSGFRCGCSRTLRCLLSSPRSWSTPNKSPSARCPTPARTTTPSVLPVSLCPSIVYYITRYSRH